MFYYYGNSYKEAFANEPVEITSAENLEQYKDAYSVVVRATNLEDENNMEKKEAITNYLKDNLKCAVELAKECMSYDGSFEDWVDTWDLEELCHCTDAYEVVRAVIYGDVRNISCNVRYNGYGNLESVDNDDLELDALNNLNDIVDHSLDLYPAHIRIRDSELQELFDEYIEEDDEDED